VGKFRTPSSQGPSGLFETRVASFDDFMWISGNYKQFKNTLLNTIFGRKQDSVKGDWRKQPIGERHKIFHSESGISLIKLDAGLILRILDNLSEYKISLYDHSKMTITKTYTQLGGIK
jgi:hypothetical protein